METVTQLNGNTGNFWRCATALCLGAGASRWRTVLGFLEAMTSGAIIDFGAEVTSSEILLGNFTTSAGSQPCGGACKRPE